MTTGTPIESTCETIESGIPARYQHLPVSPAQIEAAKSALASAERDEAGFSPTIHITEAQYQWLTWRMGLDSDFAATQAANLDPTIVNRWFTDPDFIAFYEAVLGNKREGFKYLIQHLNGKVLRRINAMIDSDSVTLQKAGVNFALRAQALLIDSIKTVDKSQMEMLLESLRNERPIQVVDASYQEVEK
jgi:hypothetical protein